MIAEINKHMLKFSILSHPIISYNPFTTTIVAVAANVVVDVVAVGRYNFVSRFFHHKNHTISLTVP